MSVEFIKSDFKPYGEHYCRTLDGEDGGKLKVVAYQNFMLGKGLILGLKQGENEFLQLINYCPFCGYKPEDKK